MLIELLTFCCHANRVGRLTAQGLIGLQIFEIIQPYYYQNNDK